MAYGIDVEELRNRLFVLMRHVPQTQAKWAEQIGICRMQFSRFINKKRIPQGRFLVIIEQFVKQKEEEYGFKS